MKQITLSMLLVVLDDVDVLDRYQAFRGMMASFAGATSVIARHIHYYEDRPDETKLVNFIAEMAVSDAFDFVMRLEDLQLAVAKALVVDPALLEGAAGPLNAAAAAAVAAGAVQILSAQEIDLPAED